MDCFQDFCLACDKQCEGSYCSQSCRLADLEKAPNSGSISPLTPTSEHQSWESSQSGYVLTPAYNFTERDEKRFSTSSAPSGRSLTPSSSRTSLSSTSSSSVPNNGISKQARAALQDYFSSFDQTRAAKRRSSLR